MRITLSGRAALKLVHAKEADCSLHNLGGLPPQGKGAYRPLLALSPKVLIRSRMRVIRRMHGVRVFNRNFLPVAIDLGEW
jgi:hypothetical protein